MVLCEFATSQSALNCWQLWANIATITASFAACSTLITTAVGLFLVVRTLRATTNQLDEMGRARSLTAFLEVHKLLESLEERERLRRYFYELTGEPGKLADTNQQKVQQIIRHMDTVAYLVQKDYVALNDFLGLYFTVIGKLWNKAKPFVYLEREKRQDSDWASHFEWLGERAEQYRAKYYPEVTFTIFSRREIGKKMKKAREE